jgi:hypothetical protein
MTVPPNRPLIPPGKTESPAEFVDGSLVAFEIVEVTWSKLIRYFGSSSDIVLSRVFEIVGGFSFPGALICQSVI